MAKKVQQLQTEINNALELEAFLRTDGLLVLDVYSEWSGPCLAMGGILKKVKMDQGDDLHLAIVKCDGVEIFHRFLGKSEPTWLLISVRPTGDLSDSLTFTIFQKSKIHRCVFGCDTTKLIDAIEDELEIIRSDDKATNRMLYDLRELTPIELERFNCAEAIVEERIQLEKETAELKRKEYLNSVMRTIMQRLNMGVILFMPHVVQPSLLENLNHLIEEYKIIAKDQKMIRILPEHFEVIGFGTDEPMSDTLREYVCGKDIFAVAWKPDDRELNPTESMWREAGGRCWFHLSCFQKF